MSLDYCQQWHNEVEMVREQTEPSELVAGRLGVLVEEFSEMLEVLLPSSSFKSRLQDDLSEIRRLCLTNSTSLKCERFIKGSPQCDTQASVELLDALGDQMSATVGVLHHAGYNASTVLRRITDSNFSKFEDKVPVLDKSGKVLKGEDYTPPDLESLVNLP